MLRVRSGVSENSKGQKGVESCRERCGSVSIALRGRRTDRTVSVLSFCSLMAAYRVVAVFESSCARVSLPSFFLCGRNRVFAVAVEIDGCK